MQKEVDQFEKKMGWSKTDADIIMSFIKGDASELNESNARHKVVDLLFECIQLANRKKMNVQKELTKHMKEATKKYRKINEYCSKCGRAIVVTVKKKDYAKGRFAFSCPNCGNRQLSIRVKK